jgi:DNA-binding beta-propeller fold protein YncE
MAISDIAAGKVVATVPIGTGTDGAAFDSVSGDAFASNADGTLTVIHQDGPDAYHVLQVVQTQPGGRNMGLDPVTHRVFVVSARMGAIPAEATAANPRRRLPVIPGSFAVMVIER